MCVGNIMLLYGPRIVSVAANFALSLLCAVFSSIVVCDNTQTTIFVDVACGSVSFFFFLLFALFGDVN